MFVSHAASWGPLPCKARATPIVLGLCDALRWQFPSAAIVARKLQLHIDDQPLMSPLPHQPVRATVYDVPECNVLWPTNHSSP